jgi:hypothetical protein
LGWTDYALGSVLLLRDVFSVFAPRRALFIKAAVASGLSLPRSWIVIWLLPGLSLGAVAAILSMLAWAAVLAFASWSESGNWKPDLEHLCAQKLMGQEPWIRMFARYLEPNKGVGKCVSAHF